MADREKVIKEFELFIKEFHPACTSEGVELDILREVLALLKEQEAVEPYMDYDGHDVWRCGNCGATMFHIEHSQVDEDWKSYAKFCRQCGKKVKWE